MKIAVPATDENRVDDHFGHCKFYKIYTLSDKEILSCERLDAPRGCGCKSNISSVLADMGVELMLAGSMGEGAVNVLSKAGIRVIRGCSGDTDALVRNYLDGLLKDSGELCKHHHDSGLHVCPNR